MARRAPRFGSAAPGRPERSLRQYGSRGDDTSRVPRRHAGSRPGRRRQDQRSALFNSAATNGHAAAGHQHTVIGPKIGVQQQSASGRTNAAAIGARNRAASSGGSPPRVGGEPVARDAPIRSAWLHGSTSASRRAGMPRKPKWRRRQARERRRSRGEGVRLVRGETLQRRPSPSAPHVPWRRASAGMPRHSWSTSAPGRQQSVTSAHAMWAP